MTPPREGGGLEPTVVCRLCGKTHHWPEANDRNKERMSAEELAAWAAEPAVDNSCRLCGRDVSEHVVGGGAGQKGEFVFWTNGLFCPCTGHHPIEVKP